MKAGTARVGLVAVFVIMAGFFAAVFAQEDAPRIGQEQLLKMLDDPALTILDARIVRDWRKSDSMIKGAIRVDPHDVSSWIGNYSPDQKIVVYCS